jgi:hypothetical protein
LEKKVAANRAKEDPACLERWIKRRLGGAVSRFRKTENNLTRAV